MVENLTRGGLIALDMAEKDVGLDGEAVEVRAAGRQELVARCHIEVAGVLFRRVAVISCLDAVQPQTGEPKDLGFRLYCIAIEVGGVGEN